MEARRRWPLAVKRAQMLALVSWLGAGAVSPGSVGAPIARGPEGAAARDEAGPADETDPFEGLSHLGTRVCLLNTRPPVGSSVGSFLNGGRPHLRRIYRQS